jgi:hypothetical protein
MRVRVAVCLAVLAGVFGLSRADADAPCEKGYHDTMPEERATMIAVLEAARAAVPEPPTGWIRTLHDDSVSPVISVCLDLSPWTYSYGRSYTRVESAEERQRVIDAAGEQVRAAAVARQPQVDAYMARMTELSTEFGAAATSGDEARLQAVNAEMAAFQTEYQRFMSEDDSAKAYEAATAAQYLDLEMSVHVSVNHMRGSPNQGAQAIDVPGAASAHQWISDEAREVASALVLFGEWHPAPDGYGLESVAPSGAAPERPHTLSVQFHAHKDRIATLIEATDLNAIAALLVP